jgi:hypothetical protein
MDALEREKQSLQLRPDGVNIFLLSRRAWVKQGLPRERDSAVLPKQGQDSAWRRHQTPDHARAVTERCSKKTARWPFLRRAETARRFSSTSGVIGCF